MEVSSRDHINVTNVVKDSFASAFAGIIGISICHPIDTIRIRMQLQSYPHKLYKTMFHWGFLTIRQEGVKGLYKGVIPSSLGAAPIYALGFASYEFAHRCLQPLRLNQQVEWFLAGIFSGLACLTVTVPAELLKWRAQADNHNFINYRRTLKEIWKTKGIKGIYQGWWVTFIRDVPWWALYFWCYNTVTAKILKPNDDPTKKHTTRAIAGALAGLWEMPSYALDVVKTKIQTNKAETTPTMWEVALKYYRTEGIRFFFKGIWPSCIWSIVWNAIIIVIYEQTKDTLYQENRF